MKSTTKKAKKPSGLIRLNSNFLDERPVNFLKPKEARYRVKPKKQP